MEEFTRKTQWHPAFCSAMKLELSEYGSFLDYVNEFNLNSKPLQIDLLIVKKEKNLQIENEIGRLFREHNILEYKSPNDSMNEDTFIKVVAYACLYKASEKKVGDIDLKDITLTFVRQRFPEKMFRWLKEKGYTITEEYSGIFYVKKTEDLPVQVIVVKDLSKESQKWLSLLKNNLNPEDAKRAVEQSDELITKEDKEHAEAVLQVAVSANRKVFTEARKEEEGMFECLRFLLEPEFTEEKEAMAREVTKEVTENVTRDMIKKVVLHGLSKGLTVAEISDYSGLPLDDVKSVEAESLCIA